MKFRCREWHGVLKDIAIMRCTKLPLRSALYAILILVLGASPVLFARNDFQVGRAAAPELSDNDIKQMLSIAEAQHEIVKLLIAQGRLDRILPEMRKIFELRLPEKYDSLVAQSASLIANLLAESKQFALAHDLLDEAQKRMRLNENKASLMKIQAYIYKSEGNLEKALQSLEKAIELEKQRNRF
jgi:tetratricopeptide (TPR) repeat protein